MQRACFAAVLALAPACASPAKTSGGKSEEPLRETEASRGVSDPRLKDLLERHWLATMQRNPVWATRLGDRRFDDRLRDESHEARRLEHELNAKWLGEAHAIPVAALSREDAVTHELFVQMIETSLELEVCNFREWALSPRDNPVTQWNDLAEIHTVRTSSDAANLLARYRQISKAIDTDIENLLRGKNAGLVANEESAKRVIAMLDTQLATPLEKWPLVAPALSPAAAFTDEERTQLSEVVKTEIKPAIERYNTMLKKELLPIARPEARTGLAALSLGKACYQALIKNHTTLNTTAEHLHQKGREEIERINKEMVELGEKLFKTSDLARILEKLRSDNSLYFNDEREIEEKAKRALDAARARIDGYFGILPRADCVIARIPDYEAPFTTIAYYREPIPNGTKPGEYFVNVYQPKTRPRFEAEVLAFHESIPGHHLQIAIAQELEALPAFRKHRNLTVFVEGWGLYTERLADEMGLYSGDLDRMGMLSYDAWRASRLVVDTGIHAMGWSRTAAKSYMLAHTALAPNNIDNEVDRYIVSPGQALAYKTGQLELRRLRGEAERALGGKFDVKGFHDAVLGRGAVSLPILQRQVASWVETRR
jgi:uncharacterized protein (DUF885 family)